MATQNRPRRVHTTVAVAVAAIVAFTAACTPTTPPATTTPPQPPATTAPPTTAPPTTAPPTTAPPTTAPPTTAPPSATAAAFRSGASANANSTSVAVRLPDDVGIGDRLVLFATANNATSTLAAPAGWTLLDSRVDATATAQTAAWTRVAIAGDAGSNVAVTSSAQAKIGVDVVAYRKAGAVTTHRVTIATTTSAQITAPSAPVDAAGSAVISYFANKSSDNTSIATPGTVTRRTSSTGTGSGRILSATADRLDVAVGTAGAVTATTQNANQRNISWTVVVAAGTTTVTPPAPWASQYPGDVAPGHVRWGAAIAGNANPARHEDHTDQPLGIRRTFHGWSARTGEMATTARTDVAAGRLPWVSIKPPVTAFDVSGWQEVADGRHDAAIDAMFTALGNAGGPVWFTFNHEPEGGGCEEQYKDANGNCMYVHDDPGGSAAWRGAQRRLGERLDALQARGVATNVAFAPILMAWTWDSRSNRNPSDWWVDDTWDLYGIDTYDNDERSSGPQSTTMFRNAHAWLTTKGIDIGIGEWGNRGTDTEAADEMTDFYNLAINSGTSNKSQIVGVAYFDSGLNSPSGSWELLGEPLTRFRQLVDDPRSLVVTRNGGS